MVRLPEHRSGHTEGRSCVITQVHSDGRVFIVPFSRIVWNKYRKFLTLFPPVEGGRNEEGYIAPNLQGWCVPSRIYRRLKPFTEEELLQVEGDLNSIPWRIVPWNYRELK